MLVGTRMSHPVITVQLDTSIEEALNLMRKEDIRRLPVVDKRGILVGIIAERQLLKAYPSDATSLSVWEVKELVRKVTVEKIMTREVTTVAEDTPLEEVARTMADSDIGAIPVMRAGKIVGIITETDLFKVFLEILGARESGVRVTAMIQKMPGKLANFAKAIFDAGGDIVALGTISGESTDTVEMTAKVQGVNKDALVAAIKDIVERIVDIRVCTI